MSKVVYLTPFALNRNLAAAKSALAGEGELVDTSMLPDSDTAYARSLYYRACELILASYEAGVLDACAAIGLKPREVAKWQQ